MAARIWRIGSLLLRLDIAAGLVMTAALLPWLWVH
jgi:hypothetical protein